MLHFVKYISQFKANNYAGIRFCNEQGLVSLWLVTETALFGPLLFFWHYFRIYLENT